jgi:hypothetical protein
MDPRFIPASLGLPPNPFLARLEPLLGEPGQAIDWGAGHGAASARLRELGWAVTAVESHPQMVPSLLVRPGLPTVCMDMRDWSPPSHDLSLFLFSIFWMPLAEQERVLLRSWEKLNDGGVLAGQILLPSDDWVQEGSAFPGPMAALDGLGERLIWDEAERDGKTLFETPKHWHILHFALRKA